MSRLQADIEQKLTALGSALVDQKSARIIIPAEKNEPGFWFGGGSITRGTDGRLFITGRYRSSGDSRTGVAKGERGKELAVFASEDNGKSWRKIVSLPKKNLSRDGMDAVSIEGSALKHTENGVELYLSTEKANVPYPEGLESFKKPGAGVWSIDVMRAASVEALQSAEVEPFLSCEDPQFLHVKDPFLYTGTDQTEYVLFCTHPFCWSSSNTGYVKRERHETDFSPPQWDFFPRGFTWDVAITRGTSAVPLPAVGVLKDREPVSLMFYDGGECLRNLDEHTTAVKRPRGYSCEEIGGLAYMTKDNLHQLHRLSVNFPLFVSPWGTGSSRYVDVLAEENGYFVIWQQSQQDCSQPLVMNYLAAEKIHVLLS